MRVKSVVVALVLTLVAVGCSDSDSVGAAAEEAAVAYADYGYGRFMRGMASGNGWTVEESVVDSTEECSAVLLRSEPPDGILPPDRPAEPLVTLFMANRAKHDVFAEVMEKYREDPSTLAQLVSDLGEYEWVAVMSSDPDEYVTLDEFRTDDYELNRVCRFMFDLLSQ